MFNLSKIVVRCLLGACVLVACDYLYPIRRFFIIQRSESEIRQERAISEMAMDTSPFEFIFVVCSFMSCCSFGKVIHLL